MNEIDPNSMPKVRATNGAQLPLRAPPLVFAIDNGDGTTENLWGVDILQGRPVVYCGCRYPFDDGMWRDRRVETLRMNGRNETTSRPGYLSVPTGGCLWVARYGRSAYCRLTENPACMWSCSRRPTGGSEWKGRAALSPIWRLIAMTGTKTTWKSSSRIWEATRLASPRWYGCLWF